MAPVEIASNEISSGIAGHFHGEKHDFSLVLGGPLYQLFRKAHLEDEPPSHLFRRILVIEAIAWLPLLLLSTLSLLTGNGRLLSFFRDIEVHARFLVALPVLILAEVIVHSRLSPVVRRFVERRIVTAEDMPRFDRAIESAMRLRNSNFVEIGLLVL